MPYWQLFYRAIWATKHREPLMTPDVAPQIYGFLRSKAIGLGATVFVVKRTDDRGGLLMRESSLQYVLDDQIWRQELEALDH